MPVIIRLRHPEENRVVLFHTFLMFTILLLIYGFFLPMFLELLHFFIRRQENY